MQFDRISVPYLQKLTNQLRSQEQTLEVRLPDGMPDIGRVLGAWGQVIVRSKEWGSGSMSLSCGVMAWVLYMPEDGDGVQSVEAWLPFTVKWDLPETRYDGKILNSCLLRSVDARSTSARKLMVRANLDVMGEAWQAAQAQIPVPGEMPKDVEMLTASYPVLLPRDNFYQHNRLLGGGKTDQLPTNGENTLLQPAAGNSGEESNGWKGSIPGRWHGSYSVPWNRRQIVYLG